MAARPVSIFIYLGGGKEGEDLEKMIKNEALKRGFIKRSGQPNISPFVVACIKVAVKHPFPKPKQISPE